MRSGFPMQKSPGERNRGMVNLLAVVLFSCFPLADVLRPTLRLGLGLNPNLNRTLSCGYVH